MPLTRKARMVGSSLVITIPSQLAKAHDIKDGDDLELVWTGFKKMDRTGQFVFLYKFAFWEYSELIQLRFYYKRIKIYYLQRVLMN